MVVIRVDVKHMIALLRLRIDTLLNNGVFNKLVVEDFEGLLEEKHANTYSSNNLDSNTSSNDLSSVQSKAKSVRYRIQPCHIERIKFQRPITDFLFWEDIS